MRCPPGSTCAGGICVRPDMGIADMSPRPDLDEGLRFDAADANARPPDGGGGGGGGGGGDESCGTGPASDGGRGPLLLLGLLTLVALRRRRAR